MRRSRHGGNQAGGLMAGDPDGIEPGPRLGCRRCGDGRADGAVRAATPGAPVLEEPPHSRRVSGVTPLPLCVDRLGTSAVAYTSSGSSQGCPASVEGLHLPRGVSRGEGPRPTAHQVDGACQALMDAVSHFQPHLAGLPTSEPAQPHQHGLWSAPCGRGDCRPPQRGLPCTTNAFGNCGESVRQGVRVAVMAPRRREGARARSEGERHARQAGGLHRWQGGSRYPSLEASTPGVMMALA